jgi:predicted  nucleic acid-binding Zn-ribbon protein
MENVLKLVATMQKIQEETEAKFKFKAVMDELTIKGQDAEIRGLRHVIKEHEAELDAVLEREDTLHEEILDLLHEINRLEGIVMQLTEEKGE